MTDPIVIDFETYPIAQRPNYPPQPVGVAIKFPGDDLRYYGFGHVAGGNNATEEEARAALHRAWSSDVPLLFHNSKFDVEVAVERYSLPMPPWDRIHDTMFLAFLHDPHSRSLELKKLAMQHLGLPPEERDLMVEWCKAHAAQIQQEYGRRFLPKEIGEWIWLVPGDIVGPYAVGDVTRTLGLWRFYQDTLANMHEAYDRERQVMPIFLRNEQQGLRVDLERLERDIAETLAPAFDLSEMWLRWRLRGDPSADLNLDADQDVAEALASTGIVTEWEMTAPTKAHPQGVRSMSKESLTRDKYADQQVFKVLGYRNRLKTALDTFLRPWEAQAKINAGRITTTWNQVRNPDGGTRTGRPSTYNHNFLNLPKSFEGRASDGWEMPAEEESFSLPRLPMCRDYVLPEDGHLWLHRDFSGQELRVFAHFESGQLLQAYRDDPYLDPHSFTKANITAMTGKELERTRVKNGTFSRMYGGGVKAVRWQAQCESDAVAKELIALLDQGMPGRKIVEDVLKTQSRLGHPIVTWGGRWYYPEKLPGRDLTYKLLNYLVQGSSADLTKQALIEWDAQAMPWERFLVTVYDEINISAPVDGSRDSLARLGAVMDADRLDCPMRSEAKIGTTWGNAVKEKDWTWEP